jgi:hypothetical protein
MEYVAQLLTLGKPIILEIMQRRLFGGIVLLALIPLFLGSCGGDETQVSGITFEVAEMTVNESDGSLTSFHPDLLSSATGKDYTITIILDRKLSQAVVLNYSLTGSASRINPAGGAVNDFSIKEGLNTIVGSDKITIEKGAEEATVIVTVFEDFSFEVDETDSPIESFTLNFLSVESGPGKLGEDVTFTMNIEEDDAVILLQWYTDGGDTYGDVDMDLFVWLEGEVVNFSASDNANPETPDPPYEGLFIPAGFPNGTYGVSYNYYSGTSDDVDFIGIMYGRLNGNKYPYFSIVNSEFLAFEGNYGLVNINNYVETEIDPAVVQEMVKNGINYTSISQITVPVSGSRYIPGTFNFDRKSRSKFQNLKMVPLPKELRSK